MPELPEVRTVVKDLKNKIVEKEIKDILIFLPKLLKNISHDNFKNKLIGEKVLSVENKGKFIIFKLTNSKFIVSHLRMEGKYHTTTWENNKHDYISFIFKDNTKLIYNDTRQFGTFHFFNEDPNKKLPLSKLAKEPGEVDLDYLFLKLQKKRIAIKTALLDQTLLVGLGNIYVNEVLWDTKVNPLVACNSLTRKKLKEIVNSAKKIMDKSTKLGGSSISSYASLDMKQGEYQKLLKIHTKEKLPCPRCKTTIKKNRVNGRGTYYCPKCQI